MLIWGILSTAFVFQTLPPVDRAEFETRFVNRTIEWANINSGSKNTKGLERMANALRSEFADLKFQTTWNLSTRSLIARRHVSHPRLKVLFVAHLDTVFEVHHPFNRAEVMEHPVYQKILKGPGVADDKGPIALIFEILQRFQKSSYDSEIDFVVFIAADEEITSLHSKDALLKAAADRDIALVFEPGWWDENEKIPRIPSSVGGNALVDWRVTGVEAHSGVAYERGRSAVAALAQHILHFEAWSDIKRHLLVNVASVDGGGKLNVRPGHAKMKVSIRYADLKDEEILKQRLADAKAQFEKDGIKIDYDLQFRWHPQYLSSSKLIGDLQHAARTLKQPEPQPMPSLARSASAILAERGFDVIDAMGPYGMGFHSDQEILIVSSAYERLNLACQFLLERLGGK